MNETIRDHIKRRVLWGIAVMVLAWISVPLGFATLGTAQPYIQFVPMAVFAGAILWLSFATRCPRCKARLGQLGFQIGLGFLKPRVNFCPYCGVSLDEPWTQHKEQQTGTVNPIS